MILNSLAIVFSTLSIILNISTIIYNRGRRKWELKQGEKEHIVVF